MRKGDVRAGEEYAVGDLTSWRGPMAARVRVMSIGPGTNVVAKVVEVPARWWDTQWRAGRRVELTTRRLTCAWSEWPQLLAAEHAKRAEVERQRTLAEVKRQQRETPDPERTLPASYEKEWIGRDGYAVEFEHAMQAGRHSGPPAVPGALSLLPSAVQRDVVAAAIKNRFGEPAATPRSTKVDDVFAAAVLLSSERHTTVPRRAAIAEHDEDFVRACQLHVAATGGSLDIPFVPRLRVDDNFGRSLEVGRPPMGWVRLAYGWTSGEKLHSPECSRISRGSREDDPPTLPLWRLDVDDLCAACGGPGVRPSPAWVAFRAAADAWEARGKRELEPWQVHSLVHLLAATATARAAVAEPDRTWEALLLDALADGMPGEEGWAAYRVAHRWTPLQDEPTGRERTDAVKLACRRLSQFSDALPATRRPPTPFPLGNVSPDGNIPGPPDVAEKALQQWWHDLDYAVDIRRIGLTVFGLPGAR